MLTASAESTQAMYSNAGAPHLAVALEYAGFTCLGGKKVIGYDPSHLSQWCGNYAHSEIENAN